MAKNEFFQIKENLGSFNFKNHKEITTPLAGPPPPPPPADNSVSVQKPAPQKRERKYRMGGAEKKKKSGNSKSPQYSPKPLGRG